MELFPDIVVHAEAFRKSYGFFILYLSIAHAVYTVINDHLLGVRISTHIIMAVVPDECIGTHAVFCPVVSEAFLFFSIVVKILETDLLSFIDGICDRVHDVIYLFIVRLDMLCCIQVTADLLCLMPAHHISELVDQGLALFRTYEP